MGLAGAADDFIGVSLGESEEFLVAGDGMFEAGHLLPGHIAHHVFALFPSLVVAVVLIGAPPDPAQFAPFHLVDLFHLLQKFSVQ